MKTIKFAPDLKRLVLDGTKTQTRRPLKGESKYKLGEIVHAEGTDCSIIVTGIHIERLDCINPSDARKEGFNNHPFTVKAFYEKWNVFYGDTKYKFGNNPLVWVYDFEVWED